MKEDNEYNMVWVTSFCHKWAESHRPHFQVTHKRHPLFGYSVYKFENENKLTLCRYVSESSGMS